MTDRHVAAGGRSLLAGAAGLGGAVGALARWGLTETCPFSAAATLGHLLVMRVI